MGFNVANGTLAEPHSTSQGTAGSMAASAIKASLLDGGGSSASFVISAAEAEQMHMQAAAGKPITGLSNSIQQFRDGTVLQSITNTLSDHDTLAWQPDSEQQLRHDLDTMVRQIVAHHLHKSLSGGMTQGSSLTTSPPSVLTSVAMGEAAEEFDFMHAASVRRPEVTLPVPTMAATMTQPCGGATANVAPQSGRQWLFSCAPDACTYSILYWLGGEEP